VLALSVGLEAFLSQEGDTTVRAQVSLPEALLQGVGGLARESAKAMQAALVTANRVVKMPAALEGVFLTAVLPLGLVRGVRRLAVLLALGMLQTMRSSADVVRGLLQSGWNPTTIPGRARPPRQLTQKQLVHPYRDSGAIPYVRAAQYLQRGATKLDFVCCIEFQDQANSLLVMTREALICFAHGRADWEMKLSDVLLIQQQTRHLRLLFLLPRMRHITGPHIQSQEIELPSTAVAEDLYEALRMVCLNSRAAPIMPLAPFALLRSALLPRNPGLI